MDDALSLSSARIGWVCHSCGDFGTARESRGSELPGGGGREAEGRERNATPDCAGRDWPGSRRRGGAGSAFRRDQGTQGCPGGGYGGGGLGSSCLARAARRALFSITN